MHPYTLSLRAARLFPKTCDSVKIPSLAPHRVSYLASNIKVILVANGCTSVQLSQRITTVQHSLYNAI